MKKILKFLYNKYDSGIYRIYVIFGLKIVTKPLDLKIKDTLSNIEKNIVPMLDILTICLININKYKSLLDSKKPLVSVIIPVYNIGEKYVRRCLDSIVNQTLKNIEIIIINDASPNEEDDKICREYQAKDSRINYIVHKENQGVGLSRIIGLNKCLGHYISFVDSDDYLDINTFQILVPIIASNNIDILSFGYKRITKDEYGKKIITSHIFSYASLFTKENILSENVFDNISVSLGMKLYNRDKLMKLNYNEMISTLRTSEDTVSTFKLFSSIQTLLTVPIALYYYVDRDNSSTKEMNKKRLLDFQLAVDEIFDFAKRHCHNENIINMANLRALRLFTWAHYDIFNITLKNDKSSFKYMLKLLENIIVSSFNKHENMQANIMLKYMKGSPHNFNTWFKGILKTYNKEKK